MKNRPPQSTQHHLCKTNTAVARKHSVNELPHHTHIPALCRSHQLSVGVMRSLTEHFLAHLFAIQLLATEHISNGQTTSTAGTYTHTQHRESKR